MLRLLSIGLLAVVVLAGAGLAVWVSTVQPAQHTVEKPLPKEQLLR